MSSYPTKVNILIRECYASLRRTDGKSRLAAATLRREYYDALTQADRALELALEGGLDDGLVRQCEILQGFCENSLRSAYAAKFDTYERLVYERAAASAAAAAAADDSSSSDMGESNSDSDSDEESSRGVGSGADEAEEEDDGRMLLELSSKRLRWAK